ncbi:hypothetical protein ACWEOE_39275 [Amycolatopsis sp. NPDC004368]
MDPAAEPMKSLLAAHPAGRIAQATEIADAVVWLSSDKEVVRGCLMHNAAVESAGTLPEASAAVERHKREFAARLVETAAEAGAPGPKSWADSSPCCSRAPGRWPPRSTTWGRSKTPKSWRRRSSRAGPGPPDRDGDLDHRPQREIG